MTLADLLADLGRAGVTLRHAGGGIGFSPRSALTPQRAGALAAHKLATLALLAGAYAPAVDTNAAQVYAERLGVADGLGLPTHPGSPAWLIAVSESFAPKAHGQAGASLCGGAA